MAASYIQIYYRGTGRRPLTSTRLSLFLIMEQNIVKLSSEINNNVVTFKQVYKNKIPKAARTKITNSENIHAYLKNVYDTDELELRECFYVIYLNRRNEILGHYLLSIGSVSGCVVSIASVIRGAALCNASGVILSHNHPSGNTQPSDADKKITKNVKEALKLIEVILLDHIIYAEDTYYSFANEGEL